MITNRSDTPKTVFLKLQMKKVMSMNDNKHFTMILYKAHVWTYLF